MIIPYFIEICVMLFGLCIGSFLNVCIYRLPLSQSIVKPRSACPECGNVISAYDNIPVISYLWLRGKCRHCRTPISFRYPLVELLTGLLALSVFKVFGLGFPGGVYFIFTAGLLMITFIDIDHRIIPDVISLPGIAFFFLCSLFLPHSVLDSVLGILAGGGSLYLVAWGYHALTGKEGMGGGDIKLLAMIGALAGWKGVLFTIFVGSSLGCIVGLILMIRARSNMKLAVPFGPFLSVGAIVHTFFGPQLIHWYLNVF
ncbi:MAG: prepilin peptidase [Deltaproteobacteria bacterium]|nr:prepilin peptidase [Deltaproteobacteria bacterium]